MKLAQVYKDYLLHQRSQPIRDFGTRTLSDSHLDGTYFDDSYLQADSGISQGEQLDRGSVDTNRNLPLLQDDLNLGSRDVQESLDSPFQQNSPEVVRKVDTAWTDNFTPISSFESQFLFGPEQHQPPTELSVVPEASASSDSESSEIPHTCDIAGLDMYLASLDGIGGADPQVMSSKTEKPSPSTNSSDNHKSPTKKLRTHSQQSPLLAPERQNALDRSNSLDGLTPKGKHRLNADQSQFERLRSLRQNTGAPGQEAYRFKDEDDIFLGAESLDASALLQGSSFQEDNLIQNSEALLAFDSAICLVINPASRGWQWWETFTNLTVLYLMVGTPYYISFCDEGDYPAWDIIEDAISWVYVADTVLQFFVAYFDSQKECWVTDLKSIMLRYIKFWFWLDLLSVIPFESLFEGGKMVVLVRLSKLPKLYRLVKVTKIVRVIRKIRSQSNFWGALHDFLTANDGLLRLLLNLVSVIIFCHWLACLWHLIPQLQDSNDNWINRSDLQDADQGTRYLASLYWVAQTVITVGYGDFPCKTVAERLVAIVAMFTGVIFVSLTVGTISSLLAELDKANVIFSEKMIVLEKLAEEFELKGDTVSKIRNAVRYGVYKSEEFDELLDSLPPSIASELSAIIYKNRIQGLHFFEDKVPELGIAVARRLTRVAFLKGDYIYVRGEYSNEMFFLHQGEVGYVIQELEDFVCLKISAGGHFGERSLIYAVPRDFCCKALTDAVVWSLDLDWFGKIFFQEYRSAGSILKEMSDERYSKLIKIHNEMLTRVNMLLATKGQNIPNPEILQASPTIANSLYSDVQKTRRSARKISNSSKASLINIQSSRSMRNSMKRLSNKISRNLLRPDEVPLQKLIVQTEKKVDALQQKVQVLEDLVFKDTKPTGTQRTAMSALNSLH